MTPQLPTLDWNVESVRAAMAPWLPGIEVDVVATIASTSSALLDRFRSDAEPSDDAGDVGSMPVLRRSSVESRAFQRRAPDRAPRLLVAELQTAGRGRQGRTWHASAGASLTFSLAVPIRRDDMSGLSLAIGVALVEALDPLTPSARAARGRIGIKWPNDLWLVGIDGIESARKLGGILIETLSAQGRRWAVIGVGINVGAVVAPDATTGVASLSELDAAATAPRALATIARPLAEALATFERDGFAAFAARFAERDLLRDAQLTTTSPDAREGIARGIDAHGALRVETRPGAMATIHGGEVVSVRPRASFETQTQVHQGDASAC